MAANASAKKLNDEWLCIEQPSKGSPVYLRIDRIEGLMDGSDTRILRAAGRDYHVDNKISELMFLVGLKVLQPLNEDAT